MSISDMISQLMKQSWFCLIAVLLIDINFAKAEISNQYFVNDVAINATAKSPAQARINAIASGQRNAFVILLNRLGVDENFASTLQDDAIADMVSSQQIIDEKIAGNNYSATLNLTFSESFVKHYLGNKVENVEIAKTAPFLLIPIKIVKNQILIWEGDNDWKLAWENIVRNNKNSPIKLLKGDVEDISNFNAANVGEGNFSNFESALNKYKVDNLILAYFEFDDIENKVNIDLKTIRKFQTNQIRLDFVNVNQLSINDLVSKVADKTFDYLVSDKNNNGLRSASNQASVNIDVLISDLGDWLTIKNKLENSNIISGLKINSISKDLVKISVLYNNNYGDITNLFARNNLFLQKKSEGGYFLSKQPSKTQLNQ